MDSAQGLRPLAHGEDSQDAGKASLCTVGMSTNALSQSLGGHAQPPALGGPRAVCPKQACVEKTVQGSGGDKCPTEPAVGQGSHSRLCSPASLSPWSPCICRFVPGPRL